MAQAPRLLRSIALHLRAAALVSSSYSQGGSPGSNCEFSIIPEKNDGAGICRNIKMLTDFEKCQQILKNV